MSSQFHLGFFVCGIDEQPVRISRVTITYELEDGYFILHPPPIEPGASSARLIVTPIERTSIGVGPYQRSTNEFVKTLQPVLHQRAKRVRRGGVGTGRDEPTYGPVKLDQPVEIRVRNTGSTPAVVDLLVDWN